MRETIIDKAMTFAERTFRDDYSGHDFDHTLRVYKMATRLAEAEGANLKIVQLAALLHDVDDAKLSPETCENKDKARKFLRENGVPAEVEEQICTIIGEISFGGTGGVKPRTIEGMCVQDADRLDAMGAIGIGRAFAYGGSHGRAMYDPEIPPRESMSEAEYRKEGSPTLNHFYEKLFRIGAMMNTDEAKKIARIREAYMREFVQRFLDEWEGRDL